jgi:hypothetical protein
MGIIISFALSVAIFVYLYFQFQRRPLKRKPDRLTSFFDLRRIVLIGNLKSYASLYSASISLVIFYGLFWMLTSQEFIEKLTNLVKDEFDDKHPKYKEVIHSLLNIPEISLGVTIGISVFLIYPYLRGPLMVCRSWVHRAIGFEESAVENASRVADAISAACGAREKAIHLIEDKVGTGPRPPEAAGNVEFDLCTYLVLHHASRDASKIGLIAAVENVANKCKVNVPRIYDPSTLDLRRLIVPSAFYLIFIYIYYVTIPMLNPVVRHVFGEIEWPILNSDNDLSGLVLGIVRFSLQVVIPSWIGLSLFDDRRRRLAGQENSRQTIAEVIRAQTLLSLFTGMICSILSAVQNLTLNGKYSIFSLRNGLDIILPCLIPPLIVVIWNYMNRSTRPIAVILFSAFSSAIVYGLFQFMYEFQSKMRGAYVHSFVLALLLSSASQALWVFFLDSGLNVSISNVGRRNNPHAAAARPG